MKRGARRTVIQILERRGTNCLVQSREKPLPPNGSRVAVRSSDLQLSGRYAMGGFQHGHAEPRFYPSAGGPAFPSIRFSVAIAADGPSNNLRVTIIPEGMRSAFFGLELAGKRLSSRNGIPVSGRGHDVRTRAVEWAGACAPFECRGIDTVLQGELEYSGFPVQCAHGFHSSSSRNDRRLGLWRSRRPPSHRQ
jgi:hypothetical protein